MVKEYVVPPPTQVVFVADMFQEDYVGGAELTTEAILRESPFRVFKLHSESLTEDLVKKNKDKFWVLCNWTGAPMEGIIALVTEKCRFAVVEYDYKYCQFRSSHLHFLQKKEPCNCHLQRHGKFVSQLYRKAEHVFFMSEGQMKEYNKHFPPGFENASVLTSAWTSEDFLFVQNNKSVPLDNTWAVLSGGTWIKNQAATEDYCKKNGISYQLIGGLPYQEFLAKLATYKGLVFHPAGFDTCPRLVVEAKLLGLDLDLNENVQHKNEPWFTGSRQDCLDYLTNGPTKRFWSKIILP